ncbi:adenylate/guanylate cyclase domain-containing protein [Kiloniella sp.]|uniref:adenylate/guanylate cyclase domain-containing protein n=1 Tax=Kiloniella sp. TaxID=1938587 RepID=UPI003B01F1C3
MERRLEAILVADVVGYSRLMDMDETGTFERLKHLRKKLVQPQINACKGRVVKLMGDGLLAEFHSAVEAVRCAVYIQTALTEHEIDQAEDHRIRLRIGVNLGEVIIEGSDIYGSGVNIAARLEGLAEPGGICISGKVYEEVGDKLPTTFEDRGEQKVKNIPEPIRVYHWTNGAAVPNSPKINSTDSNSTTGELSGTEAPLSLPNKPSIAVLPFDNMSHDPDQDYFADGLTEDIITELARFQSFFVIARNSTFVYKGQSVNVGKIGQELGVAYVVEGSVRKAGNQVRITAQLIEAASGNHIWAEHYDHDLTDIFDLQDKVTQAIVAAIPGRLESADLNRIKRKRPEDMAIYDYVLHGKMFHHRSTKDDNIEALKVLNKAIELDPEFSESYAWKACTLGQALNRGFGENKEELFAQVVETIEKALSLDDNNFECHWIMCEVRMMQARLEEAERHHKKAFALNSNDPRVVAQHSELLTWLGRPTEAADWAHQAMRLDPYAAAGRAHLLGRAHYVAKNYAEAIEAFKQVPAPSFRHHAEIAACYAQLGSDTKAGQHSDKVLSLKPDFTIADHVQSLPFIETSDREHYRDSLRKAKLPEDA